jgi:hypothetical protein
MKMSIASIAAAAVIVVLTATCAFSGETADLKSGSTHFAPSILQLAKYLQAFYVFPKIGTRYAAMLRTNLESGHYRDINDPAAVSKQLTSDLNGVSEDLHLHVRPVPPLSAAQPSSSRTLVGAESGRSGIVQDAKWIANGVAYIRFNLFPGTPETIAATEKFMREHVTSRVIIIDARTNHGGGVDEANVMLPYLYAKPTTLMDLEASEAVVKAEGFPVSEGSFFHRVKAPDEMVRFEHVVIPNPAERRLVNAKVFYLISRDTGSAAEALAFAFKLTHRATLVGQPTRGMDHFGNFVPLGQGLECFLPMGRTIDPVTGKDWEGVGVSPDVVAPADQALEVALKLAGSD